MQTDDYYVRNYNRDNDVCVWKQKNVGYYESSELSLFEIGVEKCTPGFDWGPDRKGFHTLHYVFSGKGSLMVNDRYFPRGRCSILRRTILHIIKPTRRCRGSISGYVISGRKRR